MDSKSVLVSSVVHELDMDIDDKEVVKMVVIQDTIWSGVVEVRCFCESGKIYACIYKHDEKASAFCEVKPQEGK